MYNCVLNIIATNVPCISKERVYFTVIHKKKIIQISILNNFSIFQMYWVLILI